MRDRGAVNGHGPSRNAFRVKVLERELAGSLPHPLAERGVLEEEVEVARDVRCGGGIDKEPRFSVSYHVGHATAVGGEDGNAGGHCFGDSHGRAFLEGNQRENGGAAKFRPDGGRVEAAQQLDSALGGGTTDEGFELGAIFRLGYGARQAEFGRAFRRQAGNGAGKSERVLAAGDDGGGKNDSRSFLSFDFEAGGIDGVLDVVDDPGGDPAQALAHIGRDGNDVWLLRPSRNLLALPQHGADPRPPAAFQTGVLMNEAVDGKNARKVESSRHDPIGVMGVNDVRFEHAKVVLERPPTRVFGETKQGAARSRKPMNGGTRPFRGNRLMNRGIEGNNVDFVARDSREGAGEIDANRLHPAVWFGRVPREPSGDSDLHANLDKRKIIEPQIDADKQG